MYYGTVLNGDDGNYGDDIAYFRDRLIFKKFFFTLSSFTYLNSRILSNLLGLFTNFLSVIILMIFNLI